MRLAACAPEQFAIQYSSPDDCVGVVGSACLAESSAPDDGFDVARIEACTREEAAASCDSLLKSFNLFAESSDCQASGSRAEGDACDYDSQCGGGFCSHQLSFNGQCYDLPSAGAACDVQHGCAKAICVVPTSDAYMGTCVAWGTHGDSCATVPCQPGLECLPDTRVCVDAPTLGQSCDPNASIDWCGAVDFTWYCDASTSACTRAHIAGLGEPCGDLPTGRTRCAAPYRCGSTSVCT